MQDFEQKSELEVENRGARMEVRKPVRIILRLNRFLQECHKKAVWP